MKPLEPRRLVEGGGDDAEGSAMGELLAQLPTDAQDPPGRERVWRDSVWRRLDERRGRRGSKRWWLLVPATAALAVAVWGLVPDRVPPGLPALASRVELTAGRVLTKPPALEWHETQAGDPLAEASQVRTEAQARALLGVSGIATVLVQPASALALAATNRQTRLQISGGGLVAHVSKRPPNEPFVVELHGYRVIVVGTIFSVAEGPAGSVEVSVDSGIVRVEGPDGHRWSVRAGQSWSSANPDGFGRDTIAPMDRDLLERTPIGDSPREAIRVDAHAGAGPVALVGDGLALGPAPLTWQAPIGHHHFVGSTLDGNLQGDADTAVGRSATIVLAAPSPASPPPLAPPPRPTPASPARPATSALAHSRAAAPVPTPTAPMNVVPVGPLTGALSTVSQAPSAGAAPTAGAPSRRLESAAPPASRAVPAPPVVVATPVTAPAAPDLYARAQALTAHGDYAAAAALLQRVVERGGGHADLALYELGRLKQRRLGDLSGAQQAFQSYRDGYPRGSLTQEVDLSLIETELARAELDPALGEMTHFLDRYPDSERATEVHLLKGNLLRQRGQCADAVAEYRRTGRGAFADDALYFTAWCQRQLGQIEAARSSLRDYLERFPTGGHRREAQAALAAP